MASITKRIISGHTYYYAVRCQRVNGKPRLTWQKYLGTAEDIIESRTRPKVVKPKRTKLFDYGGVMAMYDIAKRLQVVETIDQFVPENKSNPTVGEYMLLAAINRCVCPKSKRKIGQWYEGTSLVRFIPARRVDLSSQRFWDNMDKIKEDMIPKIEEALTKKVINEFGIDLRCLVYDPTNFHTFIDTFTDSPLAQRGHNKQKRNDLRQVGLALLVSTDFHIPLLHQVYQGNLQDSVQFSAITDELVSRYKIFSQQCGKITLVYDKGNNSEENFARINQSPYHFVGSLVPTHHTDLLAIPRRKYKMTEIEGVEAYRTKKNVFGKERTIIITYNDTLFIAQMRTTLLQLSKKRQKLSALIRQLKKKTKRRKKHSVNSVRKKVKAILSGQHMSELIKTNVRGRKGHVKLSYETDVTALSRLSRTLFGKTILFTDNDTWSDEEIIRAYRSQFHIEDAFKQMKNPHFVSWKPMFHWTDQKIRVHAFYCVIALTLASLLRRELAHKKIHMSIPAIFENLNEIHETALIYLKGTSKDDIVLSEMDETQQLLFDTLNLGKYCVLYNTDSVAVSG